MNELDEFEEALQASLDSYVHSQTKKPVLPTKKVNRAHEGKPPSKMWTVVHSPADYPGSFVARKWLIKANSPKATDDILIGESLGAVRDQLPPGLFRFPRDAADDPVIVESWA